MSYNCRAFNKFITFLCGFGTIGICEFIITEKNKKIEKIKHCFAGKAMIF